MGSKTAIREQTQWHKSFFAPCAHDRHSVQIASFRNHGLSLQLSPSKDEEAGDIESIMASDRVISYAGYITTGQSGYPGHTVNTILTKIKTSIYYPGVPTLWGEKAREGFKDATFNISAHGFWLSPKERESYPKVRHVAQDIPRGYFGIKDTHLIQSALNTILHDDVPHKMTQAAYSNNMLLIPVFCPSLSKDASSHEIMKILKGIQDDIHLHENTRDKKDPTREHCVMTPLFVDSL